MSLFTPLSDPVLVVKLNYDPKARDEFEVVDLDKAGPPVLELDKLHDAKFFSQSKNLIDIPDCLRLNSVSKQYFQSNHFRAFERGATKIKLYNVKDYQNIQLTLMINL